MSLRELNPPTRRRLRLHAWLLTLWCVIVGFATSWLLLHAFGLRTPAPRYGIAAIVMYSLGLVVGARIWLVQFSQMAQSKHALFGPAVPADIAAFDRDELERSQHGTRRAGRFNWGDMFGSFADGLSFDDAAGLLIVPAVIVAIAGALLVTGVVPALFLDGVTGLLAEVALQFVFGALIARRVLRPQAHDAAFLTIVGKTWLAGLLFFAASLALGWALAAINPGGATIADLLR